jgi:hypothetical protein
MVRPMCHRRKGLCKSGGVYVLAAVAAAGLAGCGIGSARMTPLEMKARDLERQNAQLTGELEQSEIELERTKAEAQALAALPPGALKEFYTLSAVTIGRFTDFYDKNENGKRDALVVYVQPTDRIGDVVKAAGVVSVQLWNLNDAGGEALLGQWRVAPAELFGLWFNSLASTAYRLTFDVALGPEILAQPLTARIEFTDSLTGQVFRDQYVIQPRIGAPKE